MPGRGTAPNTGRELRDRVADLGRTLGLDVHVEYRVGRRIWGRERHIDVVLVHPTSRKTLGIECKAQSTQGTAEEKIPATILDIQAWPIPGLVVFSGDGFDAKMKSYLVSTGKAVEFNDLDPWLRLFFGLQI